MFGLVDCNNFYASCERAFQPRLRGLPVVVLSNNDGCIIARSDEAKALGIKMGAPAFSLKEILQKNHVEIFSSNYTLYNDMSWRVMHSLTELCPLVEIYSVDEAFLGLHQLPVSDLEDYGLEVRNKILQWTKIPVSIGIAPSKTLSKVANKLAKKYKKQTGVFLIDPQNIEQSLESFPLEDIWGIGRQHARRLAAMDCKTALDFTRLPEGWVKKNMGIVGLRMLYELQGKSTLSMQLPKPKKAIATTRSFEGMVSDFHVISEAIATHAVRCAEKLRKQQSCAGLVSIFLRTNTFRIDLPQYTKSYVYQFTSPTNFSDQLVSAALKSLKMIFKEGYQYKKAGVIVSNLVPETQLQTSLFDESSREKAKKITQLMDSINGHFGKDTLKLAAQGTSKKWNPQLLSPCYTTRLEDAIKVKV